MSIVPKDWNKIGPFLVAVATAGAAWGVSNYQISQLVEANKTKDQRIRRIEFLCVKLAQKAGIPTDRIED